MSASARTRAQARRQEKEARAPPRTGRPSDEERKLRRRGTRAAAALSPLVSSPRFVERGSPTDVGSNAPGFQRWSRVGRVVPPRRARRRSGSSFPAAASHRAASLVGDPKDDRRGPGWCWCQQPAPAPGRGLGRRAPVEAMASEDIEDPRITKAATKLQSMARMFVSTRALYQESRAVKKVMKLGAGGGFKEKVKEEKPVDDKEASATPAPRPRLRRARRRPDTPPLRRRQTKKKREHQTNRDSERIDALRKDIERVEVTASGAFVGPGILDLLILRNQPKGASRADRRRARPPNDPRRRHSPGPEEALPHQRAFEPVRTQLTGGVR